MVFYISTTLLNTLHFLVYHREHKTMHLLKVGFSNHYLVYLTMILIQKFLGKYFCHCCTVSECSANTSLITVKLNCWKYCNIKFQIEFICPCVSLFIRKQYFEMYFFLSVCNFLFMYKEDDYLSFNTMVFTLSKENT